MWKAKGRLVSLLSACLAALLTLVLGVATMNVQPKTASAADGTWTLVTDASTLAAGDEIVIAATDYNYALSTTQNGNNRGQASITKSDNTIEFGGDVQVLTLEAGINDGTFAFNTGSGYLYAASSSKNYLRTETTLSANSSWNIMIADGTATIVAQGSNTRNTMQYNQSSSIFSCYGSASQKAICLYKLTESSDGGCEHDYQEEITQNATCTEKGEKTYTCSLCGDSYTEEIDALGHNEEEKEITQPATCTEAGSKIVRCTVCGVDREESIPALGHSYVDGVCSMCGEKEPIIEEYTLTFDDTTNRVSQTTSQQVWSQNGIKFTNNKASSTSNIIDSSNPVRLYASSEIIVECAGMTKIVFNCNTESYATALKDSIGDTATVSAKVVTVVFNETVDSFTVAKLSAQVRMDSITVEVEQAEECAHTNTTTNTVDATCTVAGSIVVKCDDCGSLISSDNIPALGHTEIEEITQPATCTEAGSKIVRCTVCGDETEEVIAAVGHSYVEGACSVCGEKQPTSCTLTFDNVAKRTAYTTEQQIWTENGITVTNNKKQSTTNVGDYSAPARFYKNSEIVVTFVGMVKIEFTCNDEGYATELKNSIGDTATVNGNVVTVEFAESQDEFTIDSLSAQVRMDFITVYSENEKAHIDSATITIGSDLTVNYKVTMDDALASAKMHFTVNGETYDVEGVKVDEQYVYSLNVPPQFMAENIKAELIYNDTVIASKDEYSIKTYAQNRLNDTTSDLEKQLLTDMLYYGAAAQNYKGYNTANLATNGVENLGTASTATPEKPDFDTTPISNTEIDSYPAYFTGATVWFDNVNRIRVKINTTEKVTLTINDVAVEVTGTTIDTEGILATQFDKTYKFVLSYDGTVMQTLTYSINAYAFAKKDDTNTKMSELALALYRYGVSTKAYAGV